MEMKHNTSKMNHKKEKILIQPESGNTNIAVNDIENSTRIHTTIGVYSNGDIKINGVDARNLQKHIDYNLNMRPGRAFFLDGICLNKGCLDDEQIAEYIRMFNSDSKFIQTKDSQPYV